MTKTDAIQLINNKQIKKTKTDERKKIYRSRYKNTLTNTNIDLDTDIRRQTRDLDICQETEYTDKHEKR